MGLLLRVPAWRNLGEFVSGGVGDSRGELVIITLLSMHIVVFI